MRRTLGRPRGNDSAARWAEFERQLEAGEPVVEALRVSGVHAATFAARLDSDEVFAGLFTALIALRLRPRLAACA